MVKKPSYEELQHRVEVLEKAESERRHVESKLADAERKSRIWLEHSPVCTKIIGRDLTLKYMSAAGTVALGIEDITEFYGQPFPLAFYNDAFKTSMKASLVAVLESGTIVKHEGPLVGLNGDTHWYMSTLVPVTDESGDLDYIIAVSADITDRKAAEAELSNAYRAQKEIDARFERAVDASGGYIYETDKEGGFTYLSERFEEVTGYKPSELIGSRLSDIVPADRRARVRKRLLHIATHGMVCRDFEVPIEHRDGHTTWLSVTIAPFYDSEGGCIGYCGSGADINDRKLRDAQLGLALEKADEANRAKTTFLTTMSHEIRTPLNGVLGMSHLLRRSALSDSQSEQVDAIIGSGEILLELLNDILDIAKIEENQLELETTNVDLDEILRRCRQLWSPRFEEKNIDVKIRNNCKTSSKIEGDPTRLYQILQNFMSNALKFTQSGHVSVQADFEQETNKDILLRVSVEDSGIGISDTGKKALFDRFSQVDSSISRKYGGSGLGLSICRELVTLMGGDIGVESVLGEGSTFWFTARLKKNKRHMTMPSEKGRSNPSPDHPQFDGSSQVLVAEDNLVNQKVIMAFLNVAGLQPDLVDNGARAVEMARQKNYDLILMDIQMPELDGISATAEIQSLPGYEGAVPIIALTASATTDSRRRYLESGMIDFVPKPIDPSYLMGVISKYLPLAQEQDGVTISRETRQRRVARFS